MLRCRHRSPLRHFRAQQRLVVCSLPLSRRLRWTYHHQFVRLVAHLPRFLKYDRKLNTILFRAAWRALKEVLGADERELGAILTVQTAGEALNYHPHLHGLLADGYWKDGLFTRFTEVDLKALEQAFAERVLAQLHKR